MLHGSTFIGYMNASKISRNGMAGLFFKKTVIRWKNCAMVRNYAFEERFKPALEPTFFDGDAARGGEMPRGD